MKILLIDIDTLRPDHLGCYGYHRNTSSNIDRVSNDGVRFTQCFASDTPCLPSRAAFHHARFGFHNGAINHGGKYADPYSFGKKRKWNTPPEYLQWMQVLQRSGIHTCSVSSFLGRHCAWWFAAGFNELFDCGKGGTEIATDVTDKALNFIDQYKDKDNWLLHFNIWDPHAPYRTPEEFGNPFENDPPPSWMTQEIIDKHRETYGTHSANAVLDKPDSIPCARGVAQIKNMDDYKKWVDGYDTGISFADEAVGMLLSKIDEYGLYEDMAIIITSDHGENQGELNVYGDHQIADLITCRVPMIIKWPGKKAGVDNSFHYQFDIAALVTELLGLKIPSGWDARTFKDAFISGKEQGRDYLVVSQAPWSCQRSVIWGDHILIKTYMDGLKDLPEVMLFNWREDPHELNNLAPSMPDKVKEGLNKLREWHEEMMKRAEIKEDPMMKVIEEGGPWHTRGKLNMYIDYYKKINRPELAQKMKVKYSSVKSYN